MGLVTKVFVGNEREMYHRMAEWYKSPECEGLRVAWGPYPATQGALQSWPGFVAVTNAFLDRRRGEREQWGGRVGAS